MWIIRLHLQEGLVDIMGLSNVVYTDFEAIDEKIDWETKFNCSWNDEDYPDPFVPMVINRAESDLCSGRLPEYR